MTLALAFDPVADTAVGAPGGPRGVTAELGFDSAEGPTPFVASTSKV